MKGQIRLIMVMGLLLSMNALVWAGEATSSKATWVDLCEKKIVQAYHLKAPFDGRELIVGMKSAGLNPEGRLIKLTYENASRKDRVDLDWSAQAKVFNVTRVAGVRSYPSTVSSEKEIKNQNADLEVIYRYLTFEYFSSEKVSFKTSHRAHNPEVVHVYDNGDKVTRVVTKKFSCEFLDFFSCSCMN